MAIADRNCTLKITTDIVWWVSAGTQHPKILIGAGGTQLTLSPLENCFNQSIAGIQFHYKTYFVLIIWKFRSQTVGEYLFVVRCLYVTFLINITDLIKCRTKKKNIHNILDFVSGIFLFVQQTCLLNRCN